MNSFTEILSSTYGQLELVAMILGITSVWFATRNNIAVFSTGLISTLLYVFIFIHSKLYAFAILNIYFSIMSIVGWYNWSLKNGDTTVYPIRWCTSKELKITLALFILLLIPALYILSRTDDLMPIGDGLSAGLQVLGMWWMTRRKIDNWIAYTIANIIALPLCIEAELYFTAFQYIVFLLLALKGLKEWKKLLADSRHEITN